MIRIKNLSFSYGVTPVLENITMNLEKGKIYGLLGENGVGKTTLLTLLCGLKSPKSGSIQIDGFNPFDRNPQLLCQQFYLSDDVVPVNDTAGRWAKTNGCFWPGFNLGKFNDVMRELENDPRKKMNQMSAGQLKKTYIAFALSCSARYIYMDEPTNGLDIPSKAQFRSALTRHISDESTVIISTHQVRDLENIIDPIIIMDKRDVLVNAGIEEISKKLFFDYGTVLNSQSLYTEQLPGGFIQVYPNETGADSKVNIEALFNTVHKNKEIIRELFRK